MLPSSDPGRQSPLILVVDDAESIRYARSRIMGQAGYRVIEASTGEEALLVATAHQPELVVLDVSLPGIDGLEVCRRLKTDQQMSHIMVLQVSAARTSKMDLAAGLEGGADSYLIEPIDPLELLATVKALLRLADRENRLRRSERQFAEATNAADCGLWDWDIVRGKLDWFGAHERLAGMVPGGFSGKIEAFSDILHSDDRLRVWNKLQDLMAAREEHFSDEYRFVHPDGSVHWMTAKGRFFYDDAGRAVRMTGVVQDITARKAAEEALRRSEQRYRTLVQATSAMTWSCPPSGLHVEAQPSWMAFTGQTTDEMLRDGWTKVVHPDDLAEAARRWNAAVAQGRPFFSEHRIRRHDGEWRWMNVYAEPIRDAEGRVFEWSSLNIDITERKKAEQALKKTTESLALAQRASRAGVWDWHMTEGPEAFVSAEYRALYGLDENEPVTYGKWLTLVHPDDRDRVNPYGRQAFAGRESEYQTEFRIVHPVQGERWLAGIGRIERNEMGDPIRFTGVNIDITDRKQQEAALRESELFYRQTLESIPGMAFTNKPDGSCDYVSHQWVDFTGIPAAEQLGSGWVQALHPDDRERAYAVWRAAIEGRGQYDLEYRVRRHDGPYEWFKVRGRAIRDEDGTIVRWFGTAVNVDDLKRTEQALRESEEQLRRWKDELEVRVRERTSELLATQERLMTVTSQLSLTEQRERRKLARDLHDYLAQMLVVGQMKIKMLKKQTLPHPTDTTLVQDLDLVFQQALTYTRTLIAELSPPSLQDSGLPAALKWLGERFEKDGLRVDVRAYCASVPLSEENAVVVFQAVRELLFNVMKHAGVDQATVTVTLDDDALRVAVADKGKGLKSDAMQRSVEPGHLGLVSVRERFQAMSGRVEVVSGLGQGTTVTLVLPLPRRAETRVLSPELAKWQDSLSAQRSALPKNPAIRVLLVDDHQLIRQGLRDILAADDRIRVVGEADNGEEAFLVAANVVPDVVVMDVNLPDMNGIEATKRFNKLHPQMVVIGLSFHTDEQVIRDMRVAGAETLLSKENAAHDLIATVVKSYSQRIMGT